LPPPTTDSNPGFDPLSSHEKVDDRDAVVTVYDRFGSLAARGARGIDVGDARWHLLVGRPAAGRDRSPARRPGCRWRLRGRHHLDNGLPGTRSPAHPDATSRRH
jgi:hypothetical protein